MNSNQIPRVILLGSTNVGKTSIILRKRNEGVDPQTTVVNETYDLNVKGQSMKIIDTAGQERFRAMTKSFLRNAEAAILVFDLTQIQSFNELSSFYQDFIDVKGKDTPLILVGNKSDLMNEREVTEEQIKNLSDEWGVKYILTSAQNGDNIDELFDCVSGLVQDAQINAGKKINPDDDSNQDNNPDGKKCC